MSTVYDVFMHLSFGAGTQKAEKALSFFGDSEDFYLSGRTGWQKCPIVSDKNIEKLSRVTLDDAKRVLDICEKEGIKTVSFYEKGYPDKLRVLKDKPFMLFVKGDISSAEDFFTLGMVGTRNPGAYGRECAYHISSEMSQYGAVIVSGGAKGIDFISHSGALEKGQKTLCVLGCGILSPYLSENASLREEISRNGAVISEYEPYFKATPYSFVMRNRIISGLSDALLVIEAGENSGALSTAKSAKKQNKRVLAVPGGMFSDSFSGSNNLIKEGATPVFSVEDIIKATGFEKREILSYNKAVMPDKEQGAKEKDFIFEKPDAPSHLSSDARRVYDAFDGKEMSAGDLQRKVGITTSSLLVALSELEINGIVSAVSGGRYRFL